MTRRIRWATSLLALAVLLALAGSALRLWRRPRTLVPGPRRGDPAPAYAAVGLNGDTVSLASLRGDVVLLNVWASWCTGCKLEIPELKRLQRLYADSGLRIIGVNIDEDRAAARRFIRDSALTWTNLLDDDRHVTRTFGVSPGAPKNLLIDGSGTVQAFWCGTLDSAKVQRIRDVLVTARSSRLSGSLVRARGPDPGSALDTFPEVDPRAVPPALRAAALRTALQLGWARPACTRYFAWGAAAYVRLVGACPFGPGVEADDRRARILAVADNGLVSPADEVRYLRVCPAQRDSALRPLPLDGSDCLEQRPSAAPDR